MNLLNTIAYGSAITTAIIVPMAITYAILKFAGKL